MSEAAEILQSYVHLLRRLSRAASVSVYVPPRSPGAQVILVPDGAAAPLPELESAQAAALFHESQLQRQPQGSAPFRVRSLDEAGLLHRIPVKAGALHPEEEAAGTDPLFSQRTPSSIL